MFGLIHSWGSKRRKRIPRFLWGYFLQIAFTLSKFKLGKLNCPIEDNSCDDGEFSHSYIIVYEYCGL